MRVQLRQIGEVLPTETELSEALMAVHDLAMVAWDDQEIELTTCDRVLVTCWRLPNRKDAHGIVVLVGDDFLAVGAWIFCASTLRWSRFYR